MATGKDWLCGSVALLVAATVAPAPGFAAALPRVAFYYGTHPPVEALGQF